MAGLLLALGLFLVLTVSGGAVVVFQAEVNDEIVQIKLCRHETVMDAVADALISRYYDTLGKPQGLSVVQYQDLLMEFVVFIKEDVCSNINNLIPPESCVSDEISDFVDQSYPNVLIKVGDVGKEKVILRRKYSTEEIAQCISSKLELSYKEYHDVLRGLLNFKNEKTSSALQLLKDRGFSPHHILDVGANIGEYAISISKVFPDANVFMIEANRDHIVALDQLTSAVNLKYKKTTFRHEIATVMDDVRIMTFHKQRPANLMNEENPHRATGNSLFKENTPYFDDEIIETVETTTIDDVMLKHGLTDIDFIKFDIQGAELYALKGASQTLQNVDVIQMETHVANFNMNAPSFFELHSFMESIGFGIRDQGQIFRVMPPYEMLVGMDFYWVRKSSPLWVRTNTSL